MIYMHFNAMSKGGLGKSLEAAMRAAWALARGVDWQGSDLDERHKSFSGRHPTRVKLYPCESPETSKESFVAIMRTAMRGSSPLHIVDCPAQGDKMFLDAVSGLNLLALTKSYGITLTLFVFPIDEHESLKNLRSLVKATGKNVNYVVVHNKARNSSKLYTGSDFEKGLIQYGAKTIHIPAITSSTMLAMDRVESDQRRGISFAEFASLETKLIDPVMATELGMVLAKMYDQYDAVAELLLPPELAKKVKAQAKQAAKIADDTCDDLFGFNFPE